MNRLEVIFSKGASVRVDTEKEMEYFYTKNRIDEMMEEIYKYLEEMVPTSLDIDNGTHRRNRRDKQAQEEYNLGASSHNSCVNQMLNNIKKSKENMDLSAGKQVSQTEPEILCWECLNKMKVPGSAHIACAWKRGHNQHVWFFEGFDPDVSCVFECKGFKRGEGWTEETREVE